MRHELIHLLYFACCYPLLTLASVIPTGMDPDDFFDNVGRFSKSRDENFNNGKLITSFGTASEGVRAVVIQTDGKVFLIGRTSLGAQSDFAIARLNHDGSLDAEFNASGKVQVSFGTGDDWGHAGVIQPNGKLLIAGKSQGTSSSATAYDFAITRLNTNGTLDTSFNTTGKMLLDIASGADIARAVAVTESGTFKIALAGYSWSGTQFDATFARITSNGSLDTSFFTQGFKVSALAASDNAFFGLRYSALFDSFVGVGNSYNGSNWDMTLQDSKDGTGAIGSVQTVTFGSGDDTAYALRTDNTNGVITVAGNSSNGTNLDFAILRVDMVNLALDTSFYTTGKVRQSFGNNVDGAIGITLYTDGRTLVGGYANDGSKDNFAVLRLKTDGTLDTSFFTTGKSTISVGSNQDRVQGMDALDSSNIYVGGRSWNGSNFDFGVVRLNDDGTAKKAGDLDLSFGTD